MTKLLKNTIVILSVVVLLLVLFVPMISFSNKEIDLRTQFEQKTQERTAFYDKMYKVIAQKTQIALKNDESFKNIVNLQVTGQKNGENVMWAWVQQSNPTATFTEVSKLYQDLSRAVEGQREGFFEQEKMLQDIVRQHSNLINKFPGSLYNIVYSRQLLKYSPITSTYTEKVFQSGKEDDFKLDLK